MRASGYLAVRVLINSERRTKTRDGMLARNLAFDDIQVCLSVKLKWNISLNNEFLIFIYILSALMDKLEDKQIKKTKGITHEIWSLCHR